MSKETTALVTTTFNVPSLTETAANFAAEMDGLELTFDRVKIPSGGGQAFEVPGDDPDSPDMAKELVGVIVDQHPVNVYYALAYSGSNNPPDCSSNDGKVGDGTPGGDCASCPHNQWGSDPDGGRGKACQNKRRIYLLRDGDLFPILLSLPSTSIRNFGDYLLKRVLQKGHRSHSVLTKITLKKATNSSNMTYSQAQFALAGVLDAQAAQRAAEMAEGIKAYTRNLAVQAADADYATPTPEVTYTIPEGVTEDELPFG